jgi:tetratricopeptide (TPR) repeat protein
MKHYRLIILGLIITSSLKAQTFSEKVAIKACDCLDSLETYKQLEDSLRNCTSKAMALVMIESSPEEKKILNTVQGITGVFQEVNEILPSYCYNVRRLMIVEKKKQFYDLSSIPEANEHYLKGNDFMDNGDFTNSISEFQNAIKIDNRFVYAYDHLAISYRRQENYKKAIKYYKKSLEIFPEGDVALLNIAVSYSFLKDYQNSLKYYNDLIFLYQDNPEGYFGAGKIQYVISDYENALENVFNAHRMYLDTNSDYLQDSEKLISIMYADLKDKGKINLFLEKAKKYNITIDE